MSGFLGGLLKAATSFLPGGGLLSQILPGAIEAIGDVANKVINRPEGQGIGESILAAAPGAIASAAGYSKREEHMNDAPSTSATDYLPVVHGAPTAPILPVVSTIGPAASTSLSIPGTSAAAAYEGDMGAGVNSMLGNSSMNGMGSKGGVMNTHGGQPSFSPWDKFTPSAGAVAPQESMDEIISRVTKMIKKKKKDKKAAKKAAMK